MKLALKILLAWLPVAVTLGAWQGALALDAALGCSAVGKDPKPCIRAGWDCAPLIGLAAWWGMLLWMPALLVSGLICGQILARALPRPWGARRR